MVLTGSERKAIDRRYWTWDHPVRGTAGMIYNASQPVEVGDKFWIQNRLHINRELILLWLTAPCEL